MKESTFAKDEIHIFANENKDEMVKSTHLMKKHMKNETLKTENTIHRLYGDYLE